MDSSDQQLSSETLLNLNPEEMQMLNELVRTCSKLLISDDDESFFLDPAQVLRFLRGEKFSPQDALEKWTNWYHWYKENNVASLSEVDVMAEIRGGMGFIHGFDKLGHPCIILRPRYYNQESTSIELVLRYATFLMEQACMMSDEAGSG
jgi:hypothetical protein